MNDSGESSSAALDRVAGLAARTAGMRCAVVVGHGDRTLSSSVGLETDDIEAVIALCAALGDDSGPWAVADARADVRTQRHPLVARPGGWRSLAGVPLSTGGALYVLDPEPRDLEDRLASLLDIAALASDRLELDRSAHLTLDAAVDRLHDAERLVTALQASLIPPVLPHIPFLDVVAHYRPASRAQVGGDFYDAFPIEDGTWGFVIGDVCGKGPLAAGRTSCARYSIRTAASQGMPPSEVLACTNHVLYVEGGALPDAPFVTGQFARARQRGDVTVVEFASAGHPLPTVLRADGTVEVVGVSGTWLGVLPEVDVTDCEFELNVGDTLVLITDGVHDSGSGPLQQEGLETVLRASTGLTAADLVSRVLDQVVDTQRDDIAVLAIAARRPVLAQRRAAFGPHLASAGAARQVLREALAEADRTQWSDAGTLALTEVVTNAVLHAHTPVDVRIEVLPEQLRVEVHDTNLSMPQQRSYDEQATVGRGMALVAAVTDECGVRSLDSGGKAVWFSLGNGSGEKSIDDLLAVWDVEEEVHDLSETEVPTHPAVLEDIPAMLWMAARQHHDTLLRELVLYIAEHDDVQVDLTLADNARQLISAPVLAAVTEAQQAGTALTAIPDGHPAPLPPVPQHLTLTLAVPENIGPVYAELMHALDEAERLATDGKLLARPGLPEIVAVRKWAYTEILKQLDGQPNTAWQGTAQPHFETAVNEIEDDGWTAEYLDSARGFVAADDANRIVAVSPPLAQLLGWDINDLVGRRVVTLIPSRLREAHVAGFTRHLTTGESHVLGVPLVLPVLHAAGHELMCHFMIELAPHHSKRSVYVAWIEPAA